MSQFSPEELNLLLLATDAYARAVHVDPNSPNSPLREGRRKLSKAVERLRDRLSGLGANFDGPFPEAPPKPAHEGRAERFSEPPPALHETPLAAAVARCPYCGTFGPHICKGARS